MTRLPAVGALESLVRGNRTKTETLRTVMRIVWRNGTISRTEIARLSKLNKSTLTLAVRDMMKASLLHVHSEGPSAETGGWKPIFLSIDGGVRKVLGIAVGAIRSQSVVANLAGNILEKGEHSISGAPPSTEEAFWSTVAIVMRTHELSQAEIAGVCLAFSREPGGRWNDASGAWVSGTHQ